MFNPYANYWLAADGRVFSGPKQLIVTTVDADYAAWIGAGFVATAWPRDEAGNQTNAALQDVLDPYQMFVTLFDYCIYKRWMTEQAGMTLTGSMAGMPILTGDRSQAKINGIRLAAADDNKFNTQFHAADGSIHALTAAQIIDMSNQLQARINNCFKTSQSVQAQITAGTITTRAQIDSAFAGI